MTHRLAHDLFLLMLQLSQLPDEARIPRFFAEAVTRLWPGARARFVPDGEPHSSTALPVTSGSRSWGHLELTQVQEPSPEETSLLHNALLLLALILENRHQHRLLETENERLEAAVEQRTAALLETENRICRALAEGNAGVWELDPHTGKACCHGVAGLFSRPDSDFTTFPGPFLDYLDGDTASRVSEAIRQVQVGDRTRLSLEIPVQRSDGSEGWLLGQGAALTGPDGQVEKILGTVTDVTERKRLEAELLESQKMETIGRLAGGVAHEFNNLLTTIVGYCDLTTSDPRLPPDLALGLNYSLQAAQKGASLARQLLSFARRQIIRPRLVRLSELVRGLESMLHQALEKNIHLVIQTVDEGDEVFVDPGQMEQVLMQLCLNARDSMPDGGLLELSVRLRAPHEPLPNVETLKTLEDVAIVEVRDAGRGMAREQLEHVFEPFFTTKDVGEGTGLALASCYGFIRQAGGHIKVVSTIGHGTTFRIYLPASPRPAQNRPAETRDLGTILVVEDDDMLLAFLTAALRSHGYHAVSARGAHEALQVAKTLDGRLRLLLIDLVLPEENGLRLSEKLLQEQPHLKVLFMSGYTEPSAATGPHAFLPKPFSFRVLLDRLEQLFEDSATQGAPHV